MIVGKGRTAIGILDEVLRKPPQIALLLHHLQVVLVKGDGPSEETIDQLPVVLVAMQIIVVILATCCRQRRGNALIPLSANQIKCFPISWL